MDLTLKFVKISANLLIKKKMCTGLFRHITLILITALHSFMNIEQPRENTTNKQMRHEYVICVCEINKIRFEVQIDIENEVENVINSEATEQILQNRKTATTNGHCMLLATMATVAIMFGFA